VPMRKHRTAHRTLTPAGLNQGAHDGEATSKQRKHSWAIYHIRGHRHNSSASSMTLRMSRVRSRRAIEEFEVPENQHAMGLRHTVVRAIGRTKLSMVLERKFNGAGRPPPISDSCGVKATIERYNNVNRQGCTRAALVIRHCIPLSPQSFTTGAPNGPDPNAFAPCFDAAGRWYWPTNDRDCHAYFATGGSAYGFVPRRPTTSIISRR